MAEPELIQRQREILRAFRQASGRRVQTETEADVRHNAERTAADTALGQAQRAATGQLDSARVALSTARSSLAQAGLNRLLEQTEPGHPVYSSGADPAEELARSSSMATETSDGLVSHVVRTFKIER